MIQHFSWLYIFSVLLLSIILFSCGKPIIDKSEAEVLKEYIEKKYIGEGINRLENQEVICFAHINGGLSCTIKGDR
jgi:hypothetical protein